MFREKMKVICHHCEGEAQLVGGKEIYPYRPDLFNLKFYLCKRCKAWVGTHKNSPKHAPLGRLATKEEREFRTRAHFFFDKLWQEKGMTRQSAYRWLQLVTHLSESDAHIGKFNIKQCKLVITKSIEWSRNANE